MISFLPKATRVKAILAAPEGIGMQRPSAPVAESVGHRVVLT